MNDSTTLTSRAFVAAIKSGSPGGGFGCGPGGDPGGDPGGGVPGGASMFNSGCARTT